MYSCFSCFPSIFEITGSIFTFEPYAENHVAFFNMFTEHSLCE